MKKTINNTLVIFVLAMIICSCQKQAIPQSSESIEQDESMELVTKSITPEVFDWETADYMPTPPGQAQISVPWIGAGSLAGSHTLDVINDYKKIDGWKLLYSTFSENASGPLIDPYFILYNVYRGTMRIYLYVTTQFSEPSVYLRDMLSINAGSGVSTNMLSFLQSGIIDPDTNVTCISQIQPKPINGGAPFASNKWYMIEYEFAYDSNIGNLNYQNINLVWQLDFCNVSEIKLDGNANSSINSVVSSTSSNNPFDSLSGTATDIVKGGVAIGSLQFLENQKTSGKKLGLKDSAFNAIYDGVSAIVNSITGGAPSFVSYVFSSILGGKTSSSSPAVSLKAETQISISGSNTVSGSFPSMPISWYVPGSYISSSAQNYIPLENEPLGVVGWNGSNSVTVNIRTDREYLPDDIMDTGYIYEHRESIASLSRTNFSSCIQFNPYVQDYANIQIVAHDVVAYDGNNTFKFPMYQDIYDSPWEAPDILFPHYSQLLARFIIKVEPKNGAPTTYLYKTFALDYSVNEEVITHY